MTTAYRCAWVDAQGQHTHDETTEVGADFYARLLTKAGVRQVVVYAVTIEECA